LNHLGDSKKHRGSIDGHPRPPLSSSPYFNGDGDDSRTPPYHSFKKDRLWTDIIPSILFVRLIKVRLQEAIAAQSSIGVASKED
jgi:hypothetical protein